MPIEEGLPMVRAANTGISAVIDPSGRIVARLGLGIEGVLDASLPSALPPTIYARLGDIPAAVIVAAAFLFIIRRRVHEARCLRFAHRWSDTGPSKNATAQFHQLTDSSRFAFCGCKPKTTTSQFFAQIVRNSTRSSEQDLTVPAPEA